MNVETSCDAIFHHIGHLTKGQKCLLYKKLPGCIFRIRKYNAKIRSKVRTKI